MDNNDIANNIKLFDVPVLATDIRRRAERYGETLAGRRIPILSINNDGAYILDLCNGVRTVNDIIDSIILKDNSLTKEQINSITDKVINFIGANIIMGIITLNK